jgi:hypothetical protein
MVKLWNRWKWCNIIEDVKSEESEDVKVEDVPAADVAEVPADAPDETTLQEELDMAKELKN